MTGILLVSISATLMVSVLILTNGSVTIASLSSGSGTSSLICSGSFEGVDFIVVAKANESPSGGVLGVVGFSVVAVVVLVESLGLFVGILAVVVVLGLSAGLLIGVVSSVVTDSCCGIENISMTIAIGIGTHPSPLGPYGSA